MAAKKKSAVRPAKKADVNGNANGVPAHWTGAVEKTAVPWTHAIDAKGGK